ncbi:MAG: hypothetical protein QG635_692, partial [Bacteroidota bacterium]|nr:hypothetical protein [Bacteroidota bacterium]
MNKETKVYISYLIEKSINLYNVSDYLFKGEQWNSSVNRLYYSAFNMVRALLTCIDISFKTHKGIKNMFYIHFISTNKIERKYGELYSILFNARQEADYIDYTEYDFEFVSPYLEQAREFIDVISRYIKENYLNQIDF